ncbi:hypothetical protein [Marinobacterium rhizophilum]|uniref:Uncharacterized protein n=1 Tax=Marinobacterium rhizophilum TaxID=420402 RepID=A0ABY5HFI5_9GAMM|nr:hypothetical protein [Marinobacterium rhizophilum]UTW10724.1 hypothetical protein KDW95_15690 [Marinobacterium rhizophilum]
MANEHKPLFNPLYLKLLIMILPVLIIVLASVGPEAGQYPSIHQSPARQLYWIEQPQSADNELRLLLPAPLALEPQQRILQQTVAALLQERLQQPALQPLLAPVQEARVSALAGHLQIQLRWPAGLPAPALHSALQALQQLPEPDQVHSTLARIRAQAYLEGQDPAQRLLSRLLLQLQPGASSPVSSASVLQQYHQLVTQPPILSLAGPDATGLAEQLNAAEPDQADAATVAVQSLPQSGSHLGGQTLATPSARLHLSDARLPSMYLLGAPTPGRKADDYATELLAISSLQQVLDRRPASAGGYRLVWQQSRDSGYRALILDGQPARLPEVDGTLIETTREQLLLGWRGRLQTVEGQRDQLASLAFNGLAGQPLDSLIEQLQRVPGDDIGPRIEHYLSLEDQILITLNGQSD